MATLKAVRRQAIATAKTLDDSNTVITIFRVRKRDFASEIGYGPKGNDTVMMVHVSWAKDGYYDKWHPDWV